MSKTRLSKGFTNDAIPALSMCESPIEGKFVQAWFDAMRDLGRSIEYIGDTIFRIAVEFRNPDEEGCFTLGLQGIVPGLNGGRVDAVVCYRERSVSTSYIVELDGRAFHSSPEKQQNDRARDRNLLFFGLPVIRYTGSEVWAEARAIVDNLVEDITYKNNDKYANEAFAFEAGFIARSSLGSLTEEDLEKAKIAAFNKFISGEP